MTGLTKNSIKITPLETRLMLDASLGGLVSSIVFAEDTVNASEQIIDADVTVTGTTTDFDGDTLAISTTAGAEDQLTINDEGTAAGQIGFDGTNVTYSGTIIGAITSNGANGNNLDILLNGNASKASIERLIENVTYQNTSDDPTGNRTINVSLGAEFSEDISITIVPQNDDLVLAANNAVTAIEGGNVTITTPDLNITDADDADTDLVISVTAAPTNGQLELTTNSGIAITSFTMDDIINNRVIYVHDNSETTSDSFTFTATDGDTTLPTETFNINVTPVNDPLTLDANNTVTVFQNLSLTIGNTALLSTDTDTANANIVYTVTSNVANGTLRLNGTALNLNDTFTQADLNASLITYDNSGGTSDTFTFSITDGDTVIAGQTFNITVDTSNVAPEFLNTTTIYDEDFEGGASGWNNNRTESDGAFTEFLGRFAGPDNIAGNQEIFQTFTLSGTQEYVTVEFDFYKIDSWDAERFYVFINDVQISDSGQLRHNVYNDIVTGQTGDVSFTVQETTAVRGDIGFRTWGDQIFRYTLKIPTTDGTVKVGFGSNLNSNTNDESFGIDNVLIKELSSTGIDTQEISVAENADNGEVVGSAIAFDPDVGQTLTYSTSGGTGAGIFGIDASTGDITILDNSTLDFETTTSYTLDVAVTDGTGGSDTATITINMIDVLENTAPTITNGPFSIAEDAANGDDVGTVTFSDAEGDTANYRIVGGNTNNAFQINATTGLIEVRNSATIDFDTTTFYNLRIRIGDDNALTVTRDQTVRINITDIDEAPSLAINDAIKSINSNIFYSEDTGNFYQNITTGRNFDASVAFAETQFLGGAQAHLVTITTAAEFNFVRDFVSASHIWIALSDAGEEGKWIWTEGPEAGTQIAQGNTYAVGYFENWNNNEPNSGITRNHALMHANSRWYDNWPGTNGYHSTIEWEGSEVTVINNDLYNVNHSAADASDVNNGDSVGFVLGADPEGDTLNYTIQGGNTDGIFELDAATGEIRILDTTNLDATLQDTYTLTVRATEDIGGKFDEIDITIKFNDNLSISTNTPLTVDEGASSTITTASLNITDPDGVASDTRFTVGTLPTNGQLENTINPGFQISTFTLDDIQNGRITYVHDGSETSTDSFEFSVTDGGDTITANTFNINVNSINSAPTIAANVAASTTENGRTTIDNTMLNATDPDDTATGLTYTASSLTNGHIEVGGVTQNTFTQDDIDNNRVEFIQNGAEAATATFAFSLADGGEDSAAAATGTFTLNVTAVNDSPLITANTGANVIEGAAVTITNTMLDTTDPDDSGTGLTYTLSNIINGQVELSTNAGVPIISFTQADIDANRVRFVHDGGENDAQFNVTVADGGEDTATTDTATFNLTRTPVNDSPIIAVNTGSSVNQNSIIVLNNFILRATDPDDTAAGLDYTVTGTTNGQLELLSTPNVAITTFTQDDIDNGRIVFRHSGPPTTAGFSFDVADGGEDSAVVASDTFTLTVDNTNDAPVISTNVAPTVDEGSTTVLTTAMLNAFDPDDFGSDLTWTASNYNNGIIQVSGTTQNTFTQADLSAGLVTFIHDGSETTLASFDVQLADGGEDSAAPATGTFALNITPVNEGPTLIVNDGSPNIINLNDYSVDTFDAGQDGQFGRFTGSVVSPDGSTITLQGNAWKKIDIPYTLTANTVLSFEFSTDDTHEIAGIGFDVDEVVSNGVFGYQLDGTQTWSGTNQSFNNYTVGDGWVRYDIPIGNDFVGAMSNMVFILDKDGGAQGNEATFRNVNFYENNTAISVDEGNRVTLTNAQINSVDIDDTPTGLNFTVSNLTNGHIEVDGVIQNTFTQADINNNDVEFVHDGSETLTANFDISLIDGGEDSTTAQTNNFTLIVNSINDAPTIDTNTGATMNEGASLTITTAMLNEGDADDDGAQVTYTVSSPTNGVVQVNGSTQTTFTQDDIDNNRVTFVHDGSETTAASFAISLADGGEDSASPDTSTFNITVTPQNDASTITANTGATVNEGSNVTITNIMLNSNDPDDTTAQRTYTASALLNGHIEVGGTTQNTFTQDDINNNRVVFIHDDSQTTAARFNFSLADGLEHGATADTGTFNLTVTPINDQIALTTNTGATLDEGANVTITSTMLNSSDVDDTAAQRTYTASALLNGHIEVGGTTQNTFTQDDINNNRVVFIHDDSQTTAASFNFSLADGLENTTTAVTGTFNFTVTPVNDAPIIATNLGGALLEGGSTIISNTNLNATDVDNTDSALIYTLTALPAGLIENTNTAATLSIGDTFTQGDIDNGFIRYTHNGGEHTSQQISFTLSDGSITLSSMDFVWAITPVNDTPHDLGLTSMEIDEDKDIGTSIGNLYAMDVDLPGDTFSFSIMSDPDNVFAIFGNQLRLTAELDFETAQTHSVMIRADDGNGGTIDRLMTINVRDINETPFVAPPETIATGDNFNGVIEEERRTLGDSNALIRAFLSGNQFAQMDAFYGQDGMNQILRNNMTSEISAIMENSGGIQTGSAAEVITDEASFESENNNFIQDAPSNNFTNMREMLRMLDAFDGSDAENINDNDETEATEGEDTDVEFQNLYTQFEDVLTYQEKRLAKLREALLS